MLNKKEIDNRIDTIIPTILLTSFVIIVLISFFPVLKSLPNIFQKYLGNQFATFALIFLIIIGGAEVLFITRNLHKNFWFWLSILLMFVILVFGVYFIDQTVGKQEFPTLVMRDSDNNLFIVGSLTCQGPRIDKVLFAGEEIKCFLNEPVLNSFHSNITFLINNDSNYTKMGYGTMQFIAPENVSYISFNIEGKDSEDSLRHLSVGIPYTFLTSTQSNDLNKKFLSSLYLLLGLVFLSIPLVIKNLRDLYKKEI